MVVDFFSIRYVSGPVLSAKGRACAFVSWFGMLGLPLGKRPRKYVFCHF
jgi:hypothetical protein